MAWAPTEVAGTQDAPSQSGSHTSCISNDFFVFSMPDDYLVFWDDILGILGEVFGDRPAWHSFSKRLFSNFFIHVDYFHRQNFYAECNCNNRIFSKCISYKKQMNDNSTPSVSGGRQCDICLLCHPPQYTHTRCLLRAIFFE